jgi:hypothetical protein
MNDMMRERFLPSFGNAHQRAVRRDRAKTTKIDNCALLTESNDTYRMYGSEKQRQTSSMKPAPALLKHRSAS